MTTEPLRQCVGVFLTRNVIISGNTITNCVEAIEIFLGQGISTIDNNTIISSQSYGILVRQTTTVMATKNQFTNSNVYAIFIQVTNTNSEISGNRIQGGSFQHCIESEGSGIISHNEVCSF